MRLKNYILNESFIGNEVLPYLMDAIEDKKDISTKEKVLKYLKPMGQADKYVLPVIKYLSSISDKDYKELHKMAGKG